MAKNQLRQERVRQRPIVRPQRNFNEQQRAEQRRQEQRRQQQRAQQQHRQRSQVRPLRQQARQNRPLVNVQNRAVQSRPQSREARRNVRETQLPKIKMPAFRPGIDDRPSRSVRDGVRLTREEKVAALIIIAAFLGAMYFFIALE